MGHDGGRDWETHRTQSRGWLPEQTRDLHTLRSGVVARALTGISRACVLEKEGMETKRRMGSVWGKHVKLRLVASFDTHDYRLILN